MVVLFGLVALASVVLYGRQGSSMQEEVFPSRSSYSSRPGGTKALYLTLGELGYKVRRHRRDLSRLPDGGVLFLVEPLVPVGQQEAQALKEWMAKGNFVCAFLESALPSSLTEWVGPEDPLEKPSESDSTALQPSFLTIGGSPIRVCSRLRLSTEQAGQKENDEQAPPSAHMPGAESSQLAFMAEGAAPLCADKDGITVSYSKFGAGGVLLCCSPWSVSNEGLARSKDIEMVVSALQAFAPGKQRVVLFDEYHHGYGERRSLLSLLPPTAKLGLLQIGIAVGMLLFSLGKRFGAPVAGAEGRRVRGEYISAMSLLLRRAGASDLVLGRLEERFRRDVARATGLRPSADEEEVARVAEAVRGVPREKVEGLFSACKQTRGKGPAEEERLLRIARRMREVVAECQRRR